MGKNSRERLRAKRKLAESVQRRRSEQAQGAPPDAPHGVGDPLGFFAGPHVPSQRELADNLVDQAIHARHIGHSGELARVFRQLVVGLGGEAGLQVVNRALFTRLTLGVELAWRRGWQPSELVRMARRHRSAEHGRVIVDAMAAQMRGYPAATVDPRWRAQLEELDATVWWEHDDRYVAVLGDREGQDRSEVVALLIAVLEFLAVVPPIEAVGPMPGDTRTKAAAAMPEDLDQRMLDRVRALLAKAESTEFPEEADAFTAKAQELMARHRIDHALLVATTGEREQPVTRRVSIDNPYEGPKSLLLQVVANANSCRAVWTKSFGFSTIVGFPSDLDSTELLFTSLLVQATRAMTQIKPTTDAYGRSTTRSFRQSFLTSYASRIGERLRAAATEVGQEAAASASSAKFLPVLAARDDAVQAAFQERFPDVLQRENTVNNRQGWASGRAAADRASLQGRFAVGQE